MTRSDVAPFHWHQRSYFCCIPGEFQGQCVKEAQVTGWFNNPSIFYISNNVLWVSMLQSGTLHKIQKFVSKGYTEYFAQLWHTVKAYSWTTSPSLSSHETNFCLLKKSWLSSSYFNHSLAQTSNFFPLILLSFLDHAVSYPKFIHCLSPSPRTPQ